jgi:hypothetical protein
MAEWFVNHEGKTYGPLSSKELKQLADSGKINFDTPVSLAEDGRWTRAKNVKGIFAPVRITPAHDSPPAAPTSHAVETPLAERPYVSADFDPDEVRITPYLPSDGDDDDDANFEPPAKGSYATAILSAIVIVISICIVVLNVFGGVLSGIWLAVKGEWGFIIGGIIAAALMPSGFSIASLPVLGLCLVLAFAGDPPPRWAVATIGFVAALWIAALVLGWTLLVFIAYMQHADAGLTVPLLLWGYSVTMSPLVYIARHEHKYVEGTYIHVLSAMLSYLVLTALFLAGAKRQTMYIAVGALAVISAFTCTMAFVSRSLPDRKMPK